MNTKPTQRVSPKKKTSREIVIDHMRKQSLAATGLPMVDEVVLSSMTTEQLDELAGQIIMTETARDALRTRNASSLSGVAPT